MTRRSEGLADPIDIAVGARIRLLRKVRGLSQQALAEAAGVTFQQIQKYERGSNRVSASMLSRIAAALKTPVAEMFGEGGSHSGAIDEVATLLAEPGALELLKAFSGLPRGAPRAALVDFVRALKDHPVR
jgi:transcriptional regulator with XRE-family HTH domain